jgi:hypothetical protein
MVVKPVPATGGDFIEMGSLVEELQRDALNPNVRVSDLLRKAKTIAVKLGLPELAAWVEKELNGYGTTKVPEYRFVRGSLQGFNPFHGWQPVIFEEARIEDLFAKQPIGQSVAELEHVIAQKNSSLAVPLASEAKIHLMKATGQNADFQVRVSGSEPVGILDAVRNALLDWSLKLEQSGIKGEGMSFSNDERKKAHEPHATYNIGSIQTFTGNMGPGSANVRVGGNIVSEDSKSAIAALASKIRGSESQLGLDPASKQELHQTLSGLESEAGKADASPKRINGFLVTLRGIAEKAAGSLAAQGILYELHKLMQ